MANSIALNAAMDTLIFRDASGTTNFSLSGSGVNLTATSGDIVATAASSTPSGTTIDVGTTPAKTVRYNPTAQDVEFIGIEDGHVHRSIPVGEDSINLQRVGSNLQVIQ